MASENLGFANLPNQVHRKSIKKGFEFTLMVVGQSGLGKSTLINSLFKTDLYKNRKEKSVQDLINSCVKMSTQSVDIEERGVKLKLTVVDADGFGDGLDNSHDCEPVLDYIDAQFERYFEHENGINRRHIVDKRVHCCFYFVSPDQWSLRPLDVQFMKSLHHKVNIIPLIAKADMLSKLEIAEKKKQILHDIKANGISIYSIPDEVDEDIDYRNHMKALKEAMPFAVSGSLALYDLKGSTGTRQVYGRNYAWGVHEIENVDHSDFARLKSLLVTHMQDLIEVTHELHYENYRGARIVSKLRSPKVNNSNFHETSIDDEDDLSLQSLEVEKDRQLLEKEAELKRMAEKLKQMEMMIKAREQQTQNNN